MSMMEVITVLFILGFAWLVAVFGIVGAVIISAIAIALLIFLVIAALLWLAELLTWLAELAIPGKP